MFREYAFELIGNETCISRTHLTVVINEIFDYFESLKTCDGCKFEGYDNNDNPCRNCIRSNTWQDDRYEQK